jgi:hypothetical protein
MLFVIINNICLISPDGDKLHNKDVNVASQEYLHNAVTYFRKKYGKVLFIVASNGMEWTKKNMPKDIIVKYIQGTTEADLAMLAMLHSHLYRVVCLLFSHEHRLK